MVVTERPSTIDTGVMQERTGAPSMCTVQAPQLATPQPNLVPVSLQMLAQRPQQRRLAVERKLALLAVQCECNHEPSPGVDLYDDVF